MCVRIVYVRQDDIDRWWLWKRKRKLRKKLGYLIFLARDYSPCLIRTWRTTVATGNTTLFKRKKKMFQLMQSIDSHSIWTKRAKNNEDIRALIVFHVSVGNVRQHVLQLYRKESSTVYYYRNYALMSQSNMIRVYCSGGTDMTNTNPTTNVLIKCVNGASARGADYYIISESQE